MVRYRSLINLSSHQDRRRGNAGSLITEMGLSKSASRGSLRRWLVIVCLLFGGASLSCLVLLRDAYVARSWLSPYFVATEEHLAGHDES